MSEIDILFKKLPDVQDQQKDLFTQIVDEIINNALDVALENQKLIALASSSELIVHSIIADVLNNVFGENKKASLFVSLPSSSSSSIYDSRTSSESSYRVPSYLAVRSETEVSEEVVEVEEKREHSCEQFEDIDKYAGIVVDEIVNKAIAIVSVHIVDVEIEPTVEDSLMDESERSYTTTESIVEWPSIGEFDVEIGINKIYEFMDHWDYEEDWLYCVDFLTQQSDDCSDYYKYEALWSIPTQMYPIPQATASIYFTIECSRVKPQNCPVSVTYIYEGTSFVHTLESAFSEDRLFEIIDAKLKFYQRLTF